MKKLLALLILVTTLQFGYAAIAFDNASIANTSAGSSLSYTFAVSPGSNRILVCSALANAAQTVTSYTFNGVSLTAAVSKTAATGITEYLYYLVAPAVGSSTVAVTTSGSLSASSCLSYTGVDQSSPIDATATGVDTVTTSYNTTATTVTNNAWVVAGSRTGNGFALTAGANTNVRIQPETLAFGSGALWDGGPKTPAGSFTLNVTSVSQLFEGAAIIALKPASSATTPTTLGFFRKYNQQ